MDWRVGCQPPRQPPGEQWHPCGQTLGAGGALRGAAAIDARAPAPRNGVLLRCLH
jgi:hypothetical protein